MKLLCLLFATAFPAAVLGQGIGTFVNEEPLSLQFEICTAAGGCDPQQGYFVLDSDWRWVHDVNGDTSCVTDVWDPILCPDPQTCAENCVVEGVDAASWQNNYGVSSAADEVRMDFITPNGGVGSRGYLLAPDNTNYQMFSMINKEISFTTDVSTLGCGINGALYFVEMMEDGGLSAFPTNDAGAKYGMGYCDAQCTHYVHWIDGLANLEDWENYAGKVGACCNEFDLWEANREAQSFTAHPCDTVSQESCDDPVTCGDGDNYYDGVCDKEGCDFNAYRLGDRSFYGVGAEFAVDTSRPFTVVTQFISDDGTDTGNLAEIRRLWVQDGNVIQNAQTNLTDVGASQNYDSMTDQFCSESKAAFGSTNDFADQGGMQVIGGALGRGMVLAFALWDDYGSHMLWLDGSYPTDADPDAPGIARGPCADDSGDPVDIEVEYADSFITFSQIRYGELDSTY